MRGRLQPDALKCTGSQNRELSGLLHGHRFQRRNLTVLKLGAYTGKPYLQLLGLSGPTARLVHGQVASYTRASIFTYTILGLPYYTYSIMGPQSPILIIKSLTFSHIKFTNLHNTSPR